VEEKMEDWAEDYRLKHGKTAENVRTVSGQTCRFYVPFGSIHFGPCTVQKGNKADKQDDH
jgi:hypothetical protein